MSQEENIPPRPPRPHRNFGQWILRILYILYECFIAFPIFFVATILTALFTIIACLIGNKDYWGYYPARLWSRFTCYLFLMSVEVKGRENINPKQSYVFVSNHQGAYDIWTIYGFLNHNFKWLMKKELESIFLVGPACKKAGHIMVDDSSIAGIRETITESEDTLRDGMSLVIFPEGSRTWDGKMIDFKRGAFMLAAEFKLPVVPLTIDGSFKAMPRYTYLMTPSKITLTIHPAIWPGEKGFNTKKLMKECYDTIQSALPVDEQNTESRQ